MPAGTCSSAASTVSCSSLPFTGRRGIAGAPFRSQIGVVA